MRKLSVLLIAVVALSIGAFAQDKADIYGGYSLFRLDNNATLGTSRNLNGWDAEVAGKIFPFVSIVGDINGAYQTNDLGGGTSFKNNVYNFLAGPRVSFHAGKVTPFAHVLFGVSHSILDATNAGGGSTSDNNFATAFGGGVDVKISPMISFRPAKLDYVLVKNDPLNSINGNATGLTHTNNLRYSAGVVFHF
jgi:hypothetical protein